MNCSLDGLWPSEFDYVPPELLLEGDYMPKEEAYPVDVMVRRGRTKGTESEIFAVFPHEKWSSDLDVTIWDNLCGHCGGTYRYVLAKSRPASRKDTRAMLKSLRGHGYAPRLIRRRNYQKGIPQCE